MACHSESVAAALHALRVPHIVVVEADETVLQFAAMVFFPRFYQVLLTGGTVREAFTAGQSAVALDEDLARRLGTSAAMAEAHKFKLLPEDGDHDRSLPELTAGPGTVEVRPLPALTTHPFDRRPAYFVGREEEMQEVLSRLRQQRAVLIQGVSGVGKTELAKEVARWLVARERFAPEEVVFVPLGEVRSAAQARSAVATAVGLDASVLPVQDGPGNAALAASLPPRRLFLLDEAENAIHGGGKAFRGLLEALAQSAARPWLLITAQSDVGSAHVPRYDLRRLSPQAAMALFLLEAALAADQWAHLDQAQLHEALECVDRLPRAVQLVARQWRHLRSLPALLAELRQKRDQIMADPQYPEEVKSVTVGIQLAYDRLRQVDPEAAALYPYLALFPGGLPEAGVEPMFGSGARRRVAAIENESLLERPWPDLLYLPVPFRFFAERYLPEPQPEARARYGEAVLRFYCDFPEEPHVGWVSQLDMALSQGGEAVPLARARYEQELPSIEAWLDWAYEYEPCREGRARAAHLTALLGNLYTVMGVLHRPETQARYQRALALARRCQDKGGEANTLKAIGEVQRFRKELDQALETYGQALALFRAVGARLGEANTLASMSRLALQQGRDEEAKRLLRRAVEQHAALDSKYGVAADLGNFGLVLRSMGRLEEARPYLLQAAEIFDRIGLPQLAAQTRRAASETPQTRLYPSVARMAPLLLGVVAVTRGEADKELETWVREALQGLGRHADWAALAHALQRVLDGERDPQTLNRDLDEIDQQALGLVLAALEDEEARASLEALAAGATLKLAAEAMMPEQQQALAAAVAGRVMDLAVEPVVRLAREAQQQGRGAELATQLEAQAVALAEGEDGESPAAQLAQFLCAVVAILRGQEPPPVPAPFAEYLARLQEPPEPRDES